MHHVHQARTSTSVANAKPFSLAITTEEIEQLKVWLLIKSLRSQAQLGTHRLVANTQQAARVNKLYISLLAWPRTLRKVPIQLCAHCSKQYCQPSLLLFTTCSTCLAELHSSQYNKAQCLNAAIESLQPSTFDYLITLLEDLLHAPSY